MVGNSLVDTGYWTQVLRKSLPYKPLSGPVSYLFALTSPVLTCSSHISFRHQFQTPEISVFPLIFSSFCIGTVLLQPLIAPLIGDQKLFTVLDLVFHNSGKYSSFLDRGDLGIWHQKGFFVTEDVINCYNYKLSGGIVHASSTLTVEYVTLF